jgi:hypothetical protein
VPTSSNSTGTTLCPDSLIEAFRSAECIPRRDDHLMHVLRQVKTDGLFLEFGVRAGYSLDLIADAIYPSPVYGFDSFKGLPEPWHKRRDGSATIPKGAYAQDEPPGVRSNAALVIGLFAQTLPTFIELRTESIAFINIDSDLYRSADTVLSSLNDRIVPGTILNFDEFCDWSEDERRYDLWRDGEYRAFVEWLERFNRSVVPLSRDERYAAAMLVTQ